MTAAIRVLIVDDSALVRSVLSRGLAADPAIEVVGAARDPYEARDLLVALRPDVITLDVEMPRMDGLTFLRQVRLRTRAAIIILSSVANLGNPNVDLARKLGADAVLCKPSGSTSYDLEEKLGAHLQRIVKNFGRSHAAAG